jgi:ParB-like chromosome segregation protein Spo0J
VGARILGDRTVRVPVQRLREHPRNPRRGDVEAIKASLLRHGQYVPLTVNRPAMTVLRGSHTLRAARALGWNEVDVYFVDVDDEQATRILLADNRLSDLGGYDVEELAALLGGLEGDLAATGYEQADLDRLLDELDDQGPLDDDQVPPLPVSPVTQVGDVIELAPHRLVCGDARDGAVYQRLFAGDGAGGD